MEKPPELIAFETGREVMEQLRNKHAAVSQSLEYLCTDIGAGVSRECALEHVLVGFYTDFLIHGSQVRCMVVVYLWLALWR